MFFDFVRRILVLGHRNSAPEKEMRRIINLPIAIALIFPKLTLEGLVLIL